jgi:dienelactone hydrolase
MGTPNGFIMKRLITPLFCSLIATLDAAPLPNTKPLNLKGDLSARMVVGIDKFLMREIELSTGRRATFWKRDYSSPAAYDKSVGKNRNHFRFCTGAVDKRLPISTLELKSTTDTSALLYEDDKIKIQAIRWAVLTGVNGEGLLLSPKSGIRARVVALPDADQTPEQLVGLSKGIPAKSQFARRLAEAGCQVVVPVLIDRRDEWSGDHRVTFTNQTHREWIYRQSFEMGRHVIGYEIQKILSAVDWFTCENEKSPSPAPIGVIGFGEGGLLALYAGALDTRIASTLTSGYFNNRQRVWEEPIYRNVFGLLEQFGDAEIASLIGPRALVVEHSPVTATDGPPKPRPGRRGGAAPGKISTPDYKSVSAEFQRGRVLAGEIIGNWKLIKSPDSGSEDALLQFLAGMGFKRDTLPETRDLKIEHTTDVDARQKRQVEELTEYTQQLLRFSEYERNDNFWKKLPPGDPEKWAEQCKTYREQMWKEVIGKLPSASLPINPRSRKIIETEKWVAHDVLLDVWPDVYAWGILLRPKNIKPGEKRPVVVCQHGLEGVPMDTVTRDPKERAFRYYSGFAAELADRGFVVFAPHNPYRGRDLFRVLQRKANPLGKSLFTIIVGQHNRIIDWLEKLPYVDKKRIGFYGLSYGGKTAMRVPALVPRYCLSICSADFDEWIKKCVTVDARYSYMFTGEYEMFEYNLGHTFNYAEMGALIAPRPFMVERGHKDGVAPDEWVAYEYAKIRRVFGYLGIPGRTEIEYFNGPHKINGVATYKFLHRHLNWPEPRK